MLRFISYTFYLQIIIMYTFRSKYLPAQSQIPWRTFLKAPEEFSGPNGIFLILFLQITGHFSYKLNLMYFLILENLNCLCFQKSQKFEVLVINFEYVKETSGPKSFRGSLRNARLVSKVYFSAFLLKQN